MGIIFHTKGPELVLKTILIAMGGNERFRVMILHVPEIEMQGLLVAAHQLSCIKMANF